MNMYAYVGNDPINMVDPTGLTGLMPYGPALETAGLVSNGTAKKDIKVYLDTQRAIDKFFLSKLPYIGPVLTVSDIVVEISNDRVPISKLLAEGTGYGASKLTDSISNDYGYKEMPMGKKKFSIWLLKQLATESSKTFTENNTGIFDDIASGSENKSSMQKHDEGLIQAVWCVASGPGKVRCPGS